MNKKLIISLSSITIVILMLIFSLLILNKTFFKTTYIGVQGQEIFIPKYSYFKEECCMTAAYFYSLRSKDELQKEIDNYMKDFKYFEDKSTYGYQKEDLFIQNYEVLNIGLYRKIVIVY